MRVCQLLNNHFLIPLWPDNRCGTDVQAAEEYKGPQTGGKKCAAALGKGKDGVLQPNWHVSEETVMAKEAINLEKVRLFTWKSHFATNFWK